MKSKRFIITCACFFAISLFILIGSWADKYEGADDKISEYIMEIDKDYAPWFDSIWSPTSGEIERALFTLQAAAGIVYIGYYIGRKKNVQDNKYACKNK